MWKPLLLILLMILIGTVGFRIIENIPLLDSLYMTVITIFTVGFREVKTPMSPLGQVFTILIILGGVGTALFAFTKMAEAVYEGGISRSWRRRKMDKDIIRLKDHFIVCGHGRIGRTVRERLEEEKARFVVIDNNPDKIADLKQTQRCLVIEGDATQEEILIQAGIKRAKALAALLPDDADNLYLVLTAKTINPPLFVLSKALDEDGEKKILQIGANKVVSPYKLSGLRIAQGLIRPTLVDFMDLIIRRQELELNMEEFILRKDSPLVGRSLREAAIRKHTNVIVVAIKKPGADIVFNPSPEAKLDLGDTLLVLGDKDAIFKFEMAFIGAG